MTAVGSERTDEVTIDPVRMYSPRPIKQPRSDNILNAVMVVLLVLFALSVLYPLIYIVSASLSDPYAVNSGEVWLWPVGLNFEAYDAILNYPQIVRGFLNSVMYATGTTLLACFLTLTGGYALSRRDVPGRGIVMILLVITMMFSGGMIPTYLLIRDLGLLNTPWVMILPGAVSAWNLIITRTYFQVSIPDELLETSRIDGASDFRFFAQVVLPLSKPIIAVNALLFAVGSWNSYFNALIYLTDQDLYPLQLVMRGILLQNTFDPSQMTGVSPDEIAKMQLLADKLKYALIIVASIPPLVAYPFVQKHFVKGMMIGSLKG